MKVEGFILLLGACLVAYFIFTGFIKVIQKTFNSTPQPSPVMSTYDRREQADHTREIQQQQKQLMRDQKQRIRDIQRK